jgi:hypothetical protein
MGGFATFLWFGRRPNRGVVGLQSRVSQKGMEEASRQLVTEALPNNSSRISACLQCRIGGKDDP